MYQSVPLEGSSVYWRYSESASCDDRAKGGKGEGGRGVGQKEGVKSGPASFLKVFGYKEWI